MKRKIGSLGLSPVKALGISHSGRPGSKGGPEYYLNDKINLNIVYSVYEDPKTMEEIAEDLGMTPVFLEDRIAMLLANGFLVETKGKRYTTYVKFTPKEYSLEAGVNGVRMQQKVAKILAENYVPQVRAALANWKLEKIFLSTESKATSDKFKRLRDRGFLTKDGKINIMIIKSSWDDFSKMIPGPDKSLLDEFAKYALEQAMIQAKQYPPQIQDRFVYDFMDCAIGHTVAMMVLDELYKNGTFRALNDQEKVTANLLMFADKLPE